MTETDLRAELATIHPRAHAWAVRCCREQRGEAEDVLHLAYVKVLEGKARFDGRSSFRTWFFGVVQRTAREQRRRGWVRLARLERWWREERGVEGVEADGAREDDRVRLLRASLGMLSGRQQEVLHLVFYQELTIQEAAEVLGMPVGTARTHYERGKVRLRRLLREGIDR